MLAIIRYIKEKGLADAIQTFKLKCKVYDSKILLKYDQLESNMSLEEVQDCRGLILEKDTWKILSLPLRKFFNYGEGNAAKIDLSTAKCLYKIDGTFIHVYFDWNEKKWVAATSGMAEAEGEVNNVTNTTFSQLFWNTAKLDLSKLLIGNCYMFELCTPENIVVTPHTNYSVTLLAVRNINTLSEFSYDELVLISEDLSVNLVGFISMEIQTLDDVSKNFIDMPFSEEGYVVIDKDFNRVKIKNPAYVAAHFLKSKSGFHHIMEIIKSNEVDEFIATFMHRKDEIHQLEVAYYKLMVKLGDLWLTLSKETPLVGKTQKHYAEQVFELTEKNKLKMFSGLFFSLVNNKISSISEYLREFDNKKLYEILN